MPTPDLWQVVAYEVRMFRATHQELLKPGFTEQPKVCQNAIEESAVLHTRILCEVFLTRGSQPDDITLENLFPDWRSNSKYAKLKGLIASLRTLYGSSFQVASPCWIFNKMMAHPTSRRGSSYDYTIVLNQLQQAINGIISEVEHLRGIPFTWSW
ncbi:MAG: hypothetical protein JO061_06685 [Acidobacteriaceae bacterium]|nr:hypothetical protein [Acidobacteriaceae bacterium]